MSRYINNAAIWKKKTKNGDTYLSFKADRDIKEGEYLNFFNNRFKKNDKHPDFTSSTKIEDKPSEIQQEEIVDSNDIPF